MQPTLSKTATHPPRPWAQAHTAGTHRNRGMAILLVLVAVAIMMMLYFMDIKAIFKRPLSINSDRSSERPWLEEDRILPTDRMIPMPDAPKPSLDKFELLQGRVSMDDADRGWVKLHFADNGEVGGVWNCEFEVDKRVTTFSSDFAGNIDVEKTYQDKDGPDPSRLYFITKGKYIEQVYNRRTTRGSVGIGTVYVTGWLRPNGTAEGKITLTPDKKTSVSYTWKYGT